MNEELSARDEIDADIDALIAKVLNLEAGGNLDRLLNEGIDEFRRRLYARLVTLRSSECALKGAFPPSGSVSPLPEEPPFPRGEATQ